MYEIKWESSGNQMESQNQSNGIKWNQATDFRASFHAAAKFWYE